MQERSENKRLLFLKHIYATLIVCAASLILSSVSIAANVTWEGEFDSNWNEADNWSIGRMPLETDDVFFTSGSNPCLMSVSTSYNVKSLTIKGYTGVITQDADLAITGAFYQNSGSFISNLTKTLSAYSFHLTPSSRFYRFSGSGTPADPYKIYDVYGLQGVIGFPDLYYQLANDIDASATVNWIGYDGYGGYFQSIGYGDVFSGVFNGNGYSIKNIKLGDGDWHNCALFYRLYNATVRNLGLENVSDGSQATLAYQVERSLVEDCFVTGSGYARGGMLAYIYSTSVVRNCLSTYVSENIDDYDTGGFASFMSYGAQVISCYHTGRDNTIGIKLSSEEVKSKKTFKDWDFGSVWLIDEGKSTPFLYGSIYSWKGGGVSGFWPDPENWNRRSGYPSLSSHRALIYSSEAVNINTATTSETLRLGGLQLGPLYNKRVLLRGPLEIDNSGTREGSLILLNGTLECQTGSGILLRLDGDFIKSDQAKFIAGGGTVSFESSTGISLSGSVTFENLSCLTAGKTISFDAGSRQIVNGALSVGGTAANPITLKGSIRGGTRWEIKPLGSVSITNAIIADCYNSRGTDISVTGCYDGGNNSGWVFDGYTITATSSAGGTITPSREVLVSKFATQTIVVTPSSGYYLGTVWIDGLQTTESLSGASKTFTFSNVQAHHSIEALFVKDGTRIWDGGGSTNTWSEPDNWSGNASPVITDAVIFNSSSSKGAVINFGINVASITIEAGYMGIITQEAHVNIVHSFEQYGGNYYCENLSYSFYTGSNFRIPDTYGSFIRFSGNGSQMDPYVISDVYGLQAVRCNWDKSFILANDIDASATARWSRVQSCEGFAPIGFTTIETSGGDNATHPFTGDFDGKNYVIRGLRISSNINHNGLFGAAYGAEISNLGIEGLEITLKPNPYGWGLYNSGGLAGKATNSIVEGCYTTGSIIFTTNEATTYGQYAGGLVGWGDYSSFHSCYSLVNVYNFEELSYSGGFAGILSNSLADSCYSRGNIYCTQHGGGFIGRSSSDSEIANCYSTGTITGQPRWDGEARYFGGFAAEGAYFNNCYATGNVNGATAYVGGFVGYSWNFWLYSSGCYFTDSSHINDYGTYESVSDMKKKNTFSGWDFWDKWAIDEGSGTPYLLLEEYNWTPRSGNDWTTASNWTKNLKRVSAAPGTKYDKVYINSSESFSTPATALEIGGLHLGGNCKTLTLASDLFVNNAGTTFEGSIILAGGTLECSDKQISVSGNLALSSEADLRQSTSNFAFTGESLSIISGSPSFYNLTITKPDKSVSFEAGSYNTVEGIFSTSGEASRQVLLKSTDPAYRWNLRPLNASSAKVYFSVVSGSNNLSSETIDTVRSYNGGNNNEKWTFDGHAVTAIAGQGGYISAEGIERFEGQIKEIGVTSGEVIKLTVSSKEGYYIGFVKINGLSTTEVLVVETREFYLKVDTYTSFEAYFAPIGIKIWDGGGSTSDWSEANNWTGNEIPGSQDKVVFNSTSSKASLVDSDFSVYAASIESMSNVTITQNANLAITASFEQSSGAFISNASYDFSIGSTSSFFISHTATFERFDGGDGTVGDPYVIVDVYGLQAVNCKLDKSYKLNGDIDASSTRYWNWNGVTHEGFKAIGYSNINLVPPTHPFTGGFDGNYNTVSGLYVYLPQNKFVGLFGATDGSSIINVGVENAYMSGESYVGGLIGYSDSGNIYRSYATGIMNGGYGTGGMVGHGGESYFTSCYSNSIVRGWEKAGGFVGNAAHITANDCYSTGEVYGFLYAGGFAGVTNYDSSPRFTNCYSRANVTFFNGATGIAGFSNYGGLSVNCYAGGYITGESLSAYAEIGGFNGNTGYASNCYYVDGRYPRQESALLVSEAELKKQSTFNGWDFEQTWTIDENNSYPQLMWENYTWTGSADGTTWGTAGNWLRNLKIPASAPTGSLPAEKVFIGTGEALTTPAGTLVIGALQLGTSYEGTISLGGNLELDTSSGRSGGLLIYGGAFDVTEDDRSIDLDGDLVVYSTESFNARSGTINIKDASRVTNIKGSPLFYDLRCEFPGKKISFEVGSINTIEGLFRTDGTSDNPVFLRSAVTGSRWRINLLGSRSNIHYAAVRDSHNVSIESINRPDCADFGNNINWFFGSYLIQSISNSGGTITPSGDLIVATGESRTFAITPESGYYVGFVKKDGLLTTEGFYPPYIASFENISSVHSIEVYFARDGERIWFGGDAATSNWSSAMNWTGYSVPTSDSRVVFTGEFVKNSTIDASFAGSIANLTIESSYTGTITQSKSLSISGNYQQYGGYFSCTAPQTHSLSVGLDFKIPTTEGTFIRYTGDGTTETTAYGIYDIYGLQGVAANLTKNFKLMRPIDASRTQRWNWNGTTYEGFDNIGIMDSVGGVSPTYFSGKFDGQGKVVSNLYMQGHRLGNALFSITAGSTITNLGLTNVHIAGKGFVGGMAGYCISSNISGCYVTGYVSSEPLVIQISTFEAAIGSAGGLVGIGAGCNIENCYSSGEVSMDLSATPLLGAGVGGLVGICNEIQITDCYSSSSIFCNLGVLAGGGLIGSMMSGAINHSYFSDAAYDNTLGELKTFQELGQRGTYSGWDFDDVWSMDEGINLPYFLWEIWNWDGGAGTGVWTNAENWTRKSGYPSLPTDKVYINYGSPSLTILTPAGLPLTVGALKLGSSFEGTLSLRNDMLLTPESRSGELAVLNGSLDTGAYNIRLSGDFVVKAPGQFIRDENVGSVTFADTRLVSSVYGNNSFYNFTCITPGKRLSFEAGFVQTVEGTLRLSGEAGNIISLRSMSDGNRWYLHPQSTVEAVYFIDVKDSANLSSEAIDPMYSVNAGNTSNWFGDHYVTTYTSKVGVLDEVTRWGTIEPFGVVPVEHWTSKTFTLEADPGYRLFTMMADGVTIGAVSQYTFDTVISDHSIEAVFMLRPWVVTTEANGSGSGVILPSGEVEVIYAARQVFTIEADPGSYIAYVRLDGAITNEGANPNIYTSPYYITFESTLANHTIEVSFLDLNDRWWTGHGDTTNWSEAANWTGNATPDAGAKVFFSNISTKDAVIDPLYHGSVESIYLMSGYAGVISAETVFTVEANFSMESGTFFQKSFDMYVYGDFYNTSESYSGGFIMNPEWPAGSFTSEGGALIFCKNAGIQSVTLGIVPIDNIFKTMLFNVVHSGESKVLVSDGALIAIGDFTNESGTFEVDQLLVGKDFTNRSRFLVKDQYFGVFGQYDNSGSFEAENTTMTVLGDLMNTGYIFNRSNELASTEPLAILGKVENSGTFEVRDLNMAIYGSFESSGVFRAINSIVRLGGDFTNTGYFSMEVGVAWDEEEQVYNPVSGFIMFLGDTLQVINAGGTGEGHILPIVLDIDFDSGLNDGIRRLEGPLETYALLNFTTFETNSYDLYVSIALQGAYLGGIYDSVYVNSLTPSLRQYFGNEDLCNFSGSLIMQGLSCKVPGKKLYFDEGIVTVEAGGYITIEGASVATTPEMTALLKASQSEYAQWIIDARTQSRDIKYAFVKDSLNLDSTSIETRYCVDGLNNTGWKLGRYIAVFHNAGGTIEPPEITYYEYGDTATFEVSTYEGYYLGSLLVDGVRTTTEGGYTTPYLVTFESLSTDHSIEAYFDKVGGRTWTGLGTNENWSNPQNWSGNQVPLSTEEVVFNWKGTKNSTIDSLFGQTIGAVSIESGYTGTITQARDILVTATFEQRGGSFVSPVSYGFTVEGSFRIPSTDGAFKRLGGTGSSGDPYIIYDVYGLQGMKSYKSAYFMLNNDISAESTARWNWNSVSGTFEGFSPVGLTQEAAFTGSVNGKGFVVNDLWIDRQINTLRTYIGLFGALGEGAYIYDLGIRNAHIRGYDMVGALAGYSDGGTISRCFAKGGYTFGEYAVGGLVGRITSTSTIEDSYSTNRTEAYAAGGLLGNNIGGNVSRCYSSGYVIGDTAGGFLGYGDNAAYCYYSSTDSGKTGVNLGAEPLTASQMKNKTSFSGWDFDRTWSIDRDKSYPYLMWEIYSWTGSADGTTWTNPNNWNKRSGYPSTREHKAFINSGSETIEVAAAASTLGGLQTGPDFAGTVKPATAISFDNSGTREGSLVILGGRFNVNDKNVSIYGNFKKSSGAVFQAAETRSVIFSGEAPSLIEGSATFTRLTCSVPGKALTFEAGSRQTITEVFRIIGSSGNRIVLRSSSDDVIWNIDPASAEVMNVNVKDSSNEAASYINPLGSNIDAGNNHRWFPSLALFTITASSSPNGAISPEGDVQVLEGASKTFNFTPASGYYLSSLEVNGVSTPAVPSYTFTNVMSDKTIYASFAAISNMKYITAEVSGNQGGSIEPIGIIGLQSGTGRIFRMYPDGGWYINNILVDGGAVSPLNSLYEFTNVTTDRTIAVQYALNDETVFLITAETTGGGTGTILPSSAEGPIGVKPGQNMTFFIEPGTGSHLTGLYVDEEPQTLGSQYEFINVTSNHMIAASFEPDVFTITATAGAHGTITPEGSVSVNYSTNKKFYITPAGGYRIDGLFVDGVPVTATTEYEFVNVVSDRSIYASFTVEPIAITSYAGPGGRISPSGEVKVIYGSDQTFNALPDSGYQLSGILVDGSIFTTESTYTFFGVTNAHTIEATFEAYGETTIYITADATGGGTIVPVGIVGVGPGGSQQFIMTPNSGYHISTLTVDGSSKPIESIYTFSAVSTGHTISVVFASNNGADVRLITAEARGQGEISPSGTIGVKPAASQSFIMTPYMGNALLDLQVDGAAITPVSLYTFTNVTTGHTIEAIYSSLLTPESPSGLRVSMSGTDVSLTWNEVPYATRYAVYRGANKYSPLGTGWELVASPESQAWTDTWASSNTTEAYYIVRAVNAGGEGAYSSMGVYKKISVVKNPTLGSVYRVSLPYLSAYISAESMVVSIDASKGNTKISSVTKWMPIEIDLPDDQKGGQNVVTYSYVSPGNWSGNRFLIESGSGIALIATNSFSWSVVGVDNATELSFVKNPTLGSVYRISIPYTSTYTNARSLVESIDPTFGNTKISSVTKWMPIEIDLPDDQKGGQNVVTYSYVSPGNWSGNNFSIGPGDGISIVVTNPFSWTPELVIPTVE